MFSLIGAWINDWVNNREAGDLGRRRAHYDVIVMPFKLLLAQLNNTSHKVQALLNITFTDTAHVLLLINYCHDDAIKWKHFPRYLPFVRGIYRSPVNSPHKGQWRGALMFSFNWAWTNGWVNKRKAGDFRRHRAHYDVCVMSLTLGQPRDGPSRTGVTPKGNGKLDRYNVTTTLKQRA